MSWIFLNSIICPSPTSKSKSFFVTKETFTVLLNILEIFYVDIYKIFFTRSNEVDSFDSVSFLFLSPKLHTVTFRGNPISADPEYQVSCDWWSGRRAQL